LIPKKDEMRRAMRNIPLQQKRCYILQRVSFAFGDRS
jgi:hypothetical protein